jgi:hypothetical protein
VTRPPRDPSAPTPAAALEQAIARLLDERRPGASICPSEAARAVGGEQWREPMEPARQAARRLVAAGEVEITQGAAVADPDTARGPVRLRRPGSLPHPRP